MRQLGIFIIFIGFFLLICYEQYNTLKEGSTNFGSASVDVAPGAVVVAYMDNTVGGGSAGGGGGSGGSGGSGGGLACSACALLSGIPAKVCRAGCKYM